MLSSLGGERSRSADRGEDAKDGSLPDACTKSDGKKRVKKDIRAEPSLQISEFHIAPASDQKKVKLFELVGSLRASASHGEIRKQLRAVEKKKVIDAPLHKVEQERVQRSIAYEKTQEDVSKWLPIVQENRRAEQLTFPLEKQDLAPETTDKLVNKFQPHTPLELEVAALLHGSDHTLSTDRLLTKAEERALKAMNLEEAKARRSELQKYRALLSYQEAKAKRQKRIKSKKYHRIMRKEKQKKEKKSMEELQRTNPEAHAEKLQQIDKKRIQERMSLKHKGGSRYMREQMTYRKHDKETKLAIDEMLQKNKELTQKLEVQSDSESDLEEASTASVAVTESDKKPSFSPWTGSSLSGSNPWMESDKIAPKSKHSQLKSIVNTEVRCIMNSGSDDDVVSDLSTPQEQTSRKEKIENGSLAGVEGMEHAAVEERQCAGLRQTEDGDELKEGKKMSRPRKKRKEKQRPASSEKPPAKNVTKFETLEHDSDIDEEVEGIRGSLSRKRTLEDLEAEWSADEDEAAPLQSKVSKLRSRFLKDEDHELVDKSNDLCIDPKKVLQFETRMRNVITSDLVSDEGEDDTEEMQRMTIAQAFANDDVLNEFKKEKESITNRDKPKDIDLSLPGWGEWGGQGIVTSKRKKKRFRIRAAPAPLRKDRNLCNVIISEVKDTTIQKHQVNDLPFPYRNVKQFESTVRAPIGKTWNPETTVRQLTKPKVLTKSGTIIDPMDSGQKYEREKTQMKPLDASGRQNIHGGKSKWKKLKTKMN